MARLDKLCAGMALSAAATLASFGQEAPPTPLPPKPVPEQPAARQLPPKRQVIVDNKGVDQNSVVRVVPIKHCPASEIGRILQGVDDALGEFRVTAEPNVNALVLAADEKTLEKMLRLIDALDQPADAKTARQPDATASIALKYASATNVVQALNQLGNFGGGPDRGGRIVGDARTNTILVVGRPEVIRQIETWARELDVADADRKVSTRELRYYTLKNADARLLGKTVAQTLGAMSLDVPIIADAATDTLIAIGTKEDHEVLSGIVSKLDLPAKNRPSATEVVNEQKAETGGTPKK